MHSEFMPERRMRRGGWQRERRAGKSRDKDKDQVASKTRETGIRAAASRQCYSP